MRGRASGASSANRLVISAVSSGSRAVSTPPPSDTGTGCPNRSRRRIALTAIVHTSAACLRTRSSATASPAAATSNRTGTRPSSASQLIVPVWNPTAASCTLGVPK